MTFLHKAGELIILSLLWIVCSLPIVTIGASSTALYYATVKSVRKDRGYAAKEFFRSFKRNLKSGTIVTLLYGVVIGLLLYNREYISAVTGQGDVAQAVGFLGQGAGENLLLFVIYDGILILMAAMAMYLFPVLSRFDMKVSDILKLTFVMSIRYLFITVLLLIGFCLVVYLQWNYLPIPTIAILPGAWTLLSSYGVEKAMKKYMGTAQPGEDAWYFEL